MSPLLELEGTWEEIMAHSRELAGRHVRLIVLPPESAEPAPPAPPLERRSTAASLLAYAGTWAGDDIETCRQDVYANRTPARF